jgi:phage terminase large subunit-like protein
LSDEPALPVPVSRSPSETVPEGAYALAQPMSRGERVCRFIERYCIVPEGKRVGQLFRLDPFQRNWILAVYDNVVPTFTGILSTAKKNGKTGLIAAIALCHVAGPEAVLNSQIVVGAMSRDQAGLTFNYAAKMVKLNPALDRVIKLVPSRKSMYGLARNVELKAIAADAKRTQGISPLVAILDEVGQVKGPVSPFVDAVITAQGAYDNAMLLAISTQAATDSDLFSIWIDDAKTGDDPHTVCHVYEAEEDCKLEDEEAWRASNPALGSFRSEQDLRKLARKAMRLPSFAPTFRNLNMNQRVETSDPAIPRDVWDPCGGELAPHEGIAEVYAALDLSAVSDLTALVAIWWKAEKWNVACRFWLPGAELAERVKRDKAPYDVWAERGLLTLTPGKTVDYDFVAKEFLEMAEGWNLKGVAFDRWRIEHFKAALQRQEAPPGTVELFKPFGQGFQSMSPAFDALETVLLNGQMAHANHPVLRMCVLNATLLRDASGNRKLDKRNALRKIDGAVALTMAQGLATEMTKPTQSEAFQIMILGGPQK